MNHQDLANATFRIESGNSSGSGFSFRNEKTVVTNHHVIEQHISSGVQIYAITEKNIRLRAKLISYSHKKEHDFAILELEDELPNGRIVLQPDESEDITRGKRILFAGFPHGIHDLLIHEAIISGPTQAHGFYIDGSVNGGNSGGPIVDSSSGLVVGIVTQRRFLGGGSLNSLRPPIAELTAHCQEIAQGSVSIMGIDFGRLAQLIANGLSAITDALESNANSGIGIGFKIKFANEEVLNPVKKQSIGSFVPRNSPCPCESGKKFKDCCGKIL
ncbi:trypsin-like peptidase domain-containing protein [Photobacterium sp. GB-72]|uniref:trypsin-like peptidase domain-containing protein n=1 Tax=Photobacterium sp. GB-72 TaxID=2022105 RepID=UPI000D17A2F3|nr:hypothetical protein C9J40_18035 [Photobacterium sp. GB-72]